MNQYQVERILETTFPIEVFCAVASEDALLFQQLEAHFSILQQQGLLSIWHDGLLAPGTNWKEAIDLHLEKASVVVLLVSSSFLASDYCSGTKMHRLLERHRLGEVHIIPLILRSCEWHHAPFGILQALPRNGQPVTTWNDQDAAFAEVAYYLHQFIEQKRILSLNAHTSLSVAQRNRERMLQRLDALYQDLLDDSLQQVAWLELDLVEKPDAVQNLVMLLVQIKNLPERLLPAGTSIVQVYNDANQELLILGEPGSGKSTQLYVLARHLVEQASYDQVRPLPIIFPLSSWAVKQLPLQQWMEEQIIQLYDIPKQLSHQWIQGEQIIPLLDGLDEMEEAARPACIQAINTYHYEHLHPLVVCSRSVEYTVASTQERLAFQQAVVVQPLSAAKVKATLIGGGRRLGALKAAFQKNIALQELATTPLMLSLLILTYQGTTVHDLSTKGETLQQQLFTSYVERMITRKGNNKRYSYRQTCLWLHWLAYQMRTHQQTIFSLESLQVDWLPLKTHPFYMWSTTRIFGLVVGLVIGLNVGFITGLTFNPIEGLIIGLLAGLMGGIPVWKSSTVKLTERLAWSWKNALPGLLFGLIIGLFGELIMGVLRGMLSKLLVGPLIGLLAAGISVLLVGLIFGLLFGMFAGMVYRQSATIKPAEKIIWSWKNARIGLLGGLLIGLLSVLLGKLPTEPVTGLIFGLIVGLLLGLIFGLAAGFSKKQLIDRLSLSPNEGLKRSLKNGILIVLLFVPLGSLLGWQLFGPLSGPFFGLLGGLVSGLFFGLGDVIQHYALRFWLWRSQLLPWQAADFLEDARARHLLLRVGGSYRFAHRLLLDYFADLDFYDGHETFM